MALGDGSAWDETVPSNSTVANQIDDYNRDLRVGVRSRMALEHVWPSSQTGTDEGGHHTFVTFQPQGAAPTMAGTTGGGIYVTNAAQPALMFVGSDGTTTTVVSTANNVGVVSGGTQGSIVICDSADTYGAKVLAASAPGMVLHTNTGTGDPTWSKVDLADTTEITGTLAIGNGGIGATTLVGANIAEAIQLTYTGNASDNRNMTGAGFNPNWAIVTRYDGGSSTYMKSAAQDGSDSSTSVSSGINQSNSIQDFITDGFQLGTAAPNENTKNYDILLLLTATGAASG